MSEALPAIHPAESAPGRTATGCLIRLTAVWLALSTCAVAIIGLIGAPPNTRAVILMGTALVVLWVGAGGLLMRLLRDPVRRAVQAIPLDWRIKFVLFATLLALAEEAVTVTLTDLAPLFGIPYGDAYITASGNYLDVVCLHSVVVFVPMFIGWALLLTRWDFSPNAVFLLFGLTGVTAEWSFSGPQALAQAGMWIFIYGLMVYLPVYSVPPERGARRPRWWHYPLAVFAPVIFAIPVAVIVGTLHPVRIHFDPILPDT